MCVQDFRHVHNATLNDPKFEGKVTEFKMPKGISLPETVDWRTGSAVTKVKDQVRK